MVIQRKAQGLSLHTIVISVIALVVLIVLILIFSGRLELFSKGVSECPPNTNRKGKGDLTPLGMCPGGKVPAKVIQDRENDEMIYCCRILCDRKKRQQCALNEMTCDPDSGKCLCGGDPCDKDCYQGRCMTTAAKEALVMRDSGVV